MNSSSNKFPKSERLVSEKLISLLFKSKFFIKGYPVKLVWSYLPSECNGSLINVLITVPKRNVKLAVNRNSIKRKLREIYRTNNSDLKTVLKQKNKQIMLGIIYIGKPEVEYSLLETKIKKLFSELINQF